MKSKLSLNKREKILVAAVAALILFAMVKYGYFRLSKQVQVIEAEIATIREDIDKDTQKLAKLTSERAPSSANSQDLANISQVLEKNSQFTAFVKGLGADQLKDVQILRLSTGRTGGSGKDDKGDKNAKPMAFDLDKVLNQGKPEPAAPAGAAGKNVKAEPAEQNVDGSTLVTYVLEVRAPYLAFQRFIEDLEKSSLMVEVKAIEISKDKQEYNAISGSIVISNLVTKDLL